MSLSPSNQLPDPEALIVDLASQLKPLLTAETALVGIYSGGAWLLERLLPALESHIGSPLQNGVLDAAFYRDDFSQRGLKRDNKPTELDFDVENKHIILIDDIFYTGRTIRAAMNALFDYGRPASITLAVLVNRGGRQLPIAPQLCAWNTQLKHEENLQLLQDENGKFSMTLKVDAV